MVAKHFISGLIATTSVESPTSLDEVGAICGWPLLVAANPRRLHAALALQPYDCLLFWIEEQLDVAATAALIAWSRSRGQRPYRVAVAHRMEGDVESVLRAAGAHGFLWQAPPASRFVVESLQPLLHSLVRRVAPTLPVVEAGKVRPVATRRGLVRPP